MKVLIIGSGAREHALAWKIKQSPLLGSLYVSPGNPGMAEIAECLDIKIDEIEKLCEFAASNSIDLTIVGPELPLTLGIVDKFKERGLRIFGPNKYCAQLEGSKYFAKEIMVAAGIPTAAFTHVSDLQAGLSFIRGNPGPYVLKADGLAAGKGVVIAQSRDEALDACSELFSKYPAGGVLIEQFLAGVEASFIVATDGKRILPMASSHDYKRVSDGDLGSNTGGMGSVCPSARLSPDQEQLALKTIIEPLLAEIERRGHRFCGFIYAGLMLEPSGKFSVLEFNTRLGDPECQAIMRRMQGDFLKCLSALSDQRSQVELSELGWANEVCVNVVLAAEGYPEKPRLGDEITGIMEAHALEGVQVFHAGTALNGRRLVCAGGRVLSVSALGATLSSARETAYKAVQLIRFNGRHFRTDIGRD